jgi:glycosyltransferase involved in cell wall biosynthesis
MAGVPIIVHTVHGFYFYEGMPALERRIYMTFEKVGSACCHSILSQNHQDIETAIRERICPPDRIHYLGNGIDLDQFDPDRISADRVQALRNELGIPAQQPIVGFVARLVQEKGIYEFVQAASILKSKAVPATFLVIGTPQKGKKTAISPESLLGEFEVEEEVKLLGYRDDVPDLLSLMDVVVLPSYGREGVPRILMESAALGKPVVATRVRGNVEAVEDGKTGLLVPVRDGPALANAILDLLNAPDHAAEMGRRARQRALTRFDERHFFWRTDQEYRRLLKERLKLDPTSLLEPVPST